MKKQNILKKISLIVLSSIVTISEVLAAADANIRQEKYEIEPRQEQYINDPAYPKLTTEDAGKNPKNKTKKSSENVSVATVLFTSIGVLYTIFKTEELLSALFGNPYFKLGMLMQLHNYYYATTSPVRETLLSPKRTMMCALRSFQRMKDTDGEKEKSVPQENEFEMNSASNNCQTVEVNSFDSSPTCEPNFEQTTMSCQIKETDKRNLNADSSDETKSRSFTIFKGLVSKMTEKEIEDLIEQGREFAKSHKELAEILLLRFDVVFINAFKRATEKISSLFSPKSEYNIN